MNYRAILLGTSGVMLGVITVGAVSVSAHDNAHNMGRRGHYQKLKGDIGNRDAKNHEFANELLGLSAEELKSELESGKTMEEIVTAQGYESIESFKEAVENKVREELATRGLSEKEIDAKIERGKMRMNHRLKHLSEDFDEAKFRERLESKGLSKDEVDTKIQHIQERIRNFEER